MAGTYTNTATISDGQGVYRAEVLAPGRYRVFFSPAAMEELFSLLSWGGFSRCGWSRPRAGTEPAGSVPKQYASRVRVVFWSSYGGVNGKAVEDSRDLTRRVARVDGVRKIDNQIQVLREGVGPIEGIFED